MESKQAMHRPSPPMGSQKRRSVHGRATPVSGRMLKHAVNKGSVLKHGVRVNRGSVSHNIEVSVRLRPRRKGKAVALLPPGTITLIVPSLLV